jgi:hypothetical protein
MVIGISILIGVALGLVATVLQVLYLVGIITRTDVEQNFNYSADQRRSTMFKMLDIQEHMEVLGSDGKHVGAVDHKESDRIILTRDDPKAGGKPHLILVDWVDYVDSKVHLNRPSKKAISEWQVAA